MVANLELEISRGTRSKFSAPMAENAMITRHQRRILIVAVYNA
jgi:hypothetical protein